MVAERSLPNEEGWDDAAKLNRWRLDQLMECSDRDALWGYAVRLHSVLQRMDRPLLHDPVLFRLLQMGTYDGPSHCRDHVSAIRLSTVTSSRLLDRILAVQEQVRIAGFGVSQTLTTV
jgi:hypothetical protein